MELLLGFLGALSALILLGVAGLVAHDLLDTRLDGRRERARRSEVTERWEKQAEANPRDPAAWSRLGDAYRHDDRPEDAIAAWRNAIEAARSAPVAIVEDWGHKIRMAERDIADRALGRWKPTSIAQREQPCRNCGTIAPAGEAQCPACGSPLPVDTLDQVVRHPLLRRALAADTLPVLLRWLATAFAFGIATWLPWELRGVLAIAALAVIPFWWLRRFGQGG
ncbi:MAG: hypothetical protein ACKO5K_02180 [Armatimonadota bacterium]